MSPLVALVLAAVGVFAIAVGILASARFIFVALILGQLRRRYPTLPEQRGYLLRSKFSPTAHLNEGQRLESIRQGRAKVGALSFAPMLFLDEVLGRWSGVMHFDRGAWTIEWAGLMVSAPLVFGAAFVVARARLAGDVLGQPPVPSATAASPA